MTIQLDTCIELSPDAQIMEFDSSTRDKTYRVELSTGLHFQVNEKLYHLLDCLHAPLSLTNLATAFQQRTGQTVGLEQLQELAAQLSEQGLIRQTGAQGELSPSQPVKPDKQTNAYLGLHYRRDLFAAATLAPIARALQIFFERPLALVLMTLVAIVHVVVYRQIGFPPHLDMATVTWPLFFVIFLVSIAIHELGHLAACQRWQCPHGPLGFGLYFFNPVFYVDVTAVWRLTRQQRAVVDLGGIYLQLLCVPLFWLGSLVTHDPTYLFAIVVTDLLILSNFEPMMKLDGYWLLSDLTGVPNLHTRAGEAVQRGALWLLWRLGRRNARPQASAFSHWSPKVRWVMFIYIGLSIAIWPFFILSMIPMLVTAIITYPALWQAAFVALGEAMRTHDLFLLFGQLSVLFLPT
ncbi:MAG: hypothetical protein NT075_00185, partial [Chloroflexi bacterium]|nr:hypothetical protein [Chloroflexota bacterium]